MSLKDLSFSDLELFVVLSELKSVRAVSRERNQNPSQVSKALKRIEENAGVVLFKRTALGISLTPEGTTFKQNARAILGQLPLLGQTHAGSKRVKQKIYTIGSTSLLNVHLLPKALTEVARHASNVQFRTLDLAPDQIANLGLKGLFDIAVHWGPLKWTNNWESRAIGEMKYGLFARKGHPLLPRATVEQVKVYPFLLPIYLQQTSVRFGHDRCPLSLDHRISGDHTASATMAVKIAQDSDQLLFVPKAVADGSDLAEIQVEGWKSVKQPIFLSMNTENVQKTLADSLADSLRTLIT